MNKVIFCGRTTKDIEMRYSQGENSMAIGRFSIAIDSGYGDKKKTNFFNCTVWCLVSAARITTLCSCM